MKKKEIWEKMKIKRNYFPLNFRSPPKKIPFWLRAWLCVKSEKAFQICRERQLAGQHKLTEVRYDMNNFNLLYRNTGFEMLTSYWLVIAQGLHYDVIN